MKAYIWLTSIEVRHGESWIVGSGAAAVSINDAKKVLYSFSPESLENPPTYVFDAPSLVAGQRLEFTCRLVEPSTPKAMVSYGV
jgi:hypothetical protein